MNLQMLSDWLEAHEFEVDAAQNLASARECVVAKRPDAVLLDIRLGAEDGLDFARWIRTQPLYCDIPVIAVTAHALAFEKEHMLAEGCNAVVSKPVDFKQLTR